MKPKISSAYSWLAVIVVSWAVYVCASLWLCGDGFLHKEASGFIPHYMSGRPLAELLHDDHATEWDDQAAEGGNHRARVLSYLFDWLDCHFISFCVDRGHPHFFSAAHYLFFLIGGVALWRIATRYLRLGHPVGFCLALLLWTSPSAMLYTSYFRSAKTGVMMVSILMLWMWFSAKDINARTGVARLKLFLFGVLAACLPLFDEQGLYLLCLFVLFLGQNAWLHREACHRLLLISAVAGLAVALAYSRLLSPWLTQKLLGYEVNFSFSRLPFAEIFSNPSQMGKILLGAPLLALDSFRFPVGNLPIGAALLAWWWICRQFPSNYPTPLGRYGRFIAPRALFFYFCCSIVLMYVLMLVRADYLLSSEHRRFFYCVPVSATWLALLAAACSQFAMDFPKRQRLLVVGGVLLLASNMAALQEHRFVLRHGCYKLAVENAKRMRCVLRKDQILRQGIAAADVSQLTAKAPAMSDDPKLPLSEDRIYLFFMQREAARSGN